MGNNQPEREYEEKRLKQTISFAKGQLKQAEESAEKKKSEIVESKKEVRENTTHSITNLYSSDDFEALIELSQSINPVTDKIVDYEEEKHKILLLENMIKSPYFARIDFKFDDEDEFEQIYIGRSSLRKNSYEEMYVYDWRSPIASIFYRFMKGEAFYDAPCGRITGELSLKRQYEIKNSILEYFFDTDIEIVDEFLRQLLSQNTTAKMKAIVETIQQDQDVIIRDMENDLLMVQGVAGSGKTSIALHRAAYLMYQGLQTKLSANNIMILSPNTIFEQYISQVLPELGENNVVSLVFEDILHTILEGRKIQSKNNFLEHLIGDSPYKEIIRKSMEFKTSKPFVHMLDQFLSDIPYQWIPFDDVYYEGKCVVGKEALKEKILGRKETPLGIRLEQLEDYILEEIFRLLFSNAKFTILGDMKQTLGKREDITLYEQIQKILNKKKSSLILFEKSFRCTNEILNFSLKFIEHNTEIKSFNRKGDNTQVLVADDSKSLIEHIVNEVKLCQEKGFQSIGLICKTEHNSIQLFQKIKDKLDIALITHRSTSDLRGVFIIPVYMSKGLEFDAVLICDADSQNYQDEDDKNLLYVACTRALHRLSAFCEKEISPLIS